MKKVAKNVRGTSSVERLVHFQCCRCKGWWGIGDAPKRFGWYCPWCGVKQSFIDKTPKHLKK